ncbi:MULTISPECIES: glycosyltransferase family 61 protein [unclassified Mesorhizobium]|uniref:glycosyltransferase 61 family protein n=1 Tax=unclassified Mesorhizobium TaxID=325217 RepID=UPI000FD3CB48|nr:MULTISPECIES: glycosyltransferase family 61 protein [unclassified Mesorhizobium]RUX09710.1 glycosyltransferase family 61 protein [Mesorhizobium sp. M8A.F.Ca.ET.059.01.1.1]RWC90064.1 MAG: glycosyltransferase family 61 protein [Mesorhizobium sp.]TGT41342.1 glycosyltransferase family 61 protein [Mesorhizobium sp. M8A.F.Ca.ET.165.01.1.1]TGU93982.1 glycosyltransferase family 61 protein [Mesorhizobium sp. M00.F.Ca.ET.151.01.1.1]
MPSAPAVFDESSPVQSAFHHDLEPGYRTIAYATVTETVFDKATMTYKGAVYDSAGALVFHSLRPASPLYTYRPDIPVSRNLEPTVDPLQLEEAIYGGHFFYAWGHFLIETLSSAAVANELPKVPVVFSPWEITAQNEWTTGYERHVAPILNAAGWGKRRIIVTARPVLAKSLYVPQRLTAFGTASPSIHPAISSVYDRIRSTFNQSSHDETVLVMRSEDHRRWHPSERAVYEALADRGVLAILPQNMTAKAQVAAISRAKTLIGFTGSVLHNSVFMEKQTRVIEIGDQPEKSVADRIQSELCGICSQDLVFVPGFKGAPRSANALSSSILDAAGLSR